MSNRLYTLWLSVEPLIRVWARRYITNSETRLYDIDDLMQAGFLAVYDTAATHDPNKGEFNTLLRYHVRHRFAEVSGRSGTKQRPEVYAARLDEPLTDEDSAARVDMLEDPAADFQDSLIERIAAEQDAAVILAEIERLPEEQRNALMLTAWDGLTLSGAADIMGVSTELLRGYRDKAVRKIRHTRAVRKIGASRYRRHVSLSEFRVTHTSAVEWALLQAERET